MEEDRVVPHLLPAVYVDVVEPASLLVRVHPEVLAEPLRGVGLPGPDGAVQERVRGEPAVPHGPEDREQPLGLGLPGRELLRNVVKGDLRAVLEHGRPRAEAHPPLVGISSLKALAGDSMAGPMAGRETLYCFVWLRRPDTGSPIRMGHPRVDIEAVAMQSA